MKTIRWELPFKTEHYLLSLTKEIAHHPAIILITAVKDFYGNVDSCNITFNEEATDKVVLYLGATIGAHSVSFAMDRMEAQQQIMGVLGNLLDFVSENCCEEEEENDVIILEESYLVQNAEIEEVIFEEEEDLFEEEETQEIINIEELPDSAAKQLLRKVLRNFKK